MKRNFSAVPYSFLDGTTGQLKTWYGFHDDFLMVSANHAYSKKQGRWLSGGPFHVQHVNKTHFVGPQIHWMLMEFIGQANPTLGMALPISRFP